MTNPYSVLGVAPTASEEEITQAYRRMAKKYHPDLNPGNKEAEKKMREVNSAYEQIKSRQQGGARNGLGIMQAVRNCIISRQYLQAISLLSEIDERNAEWYYYSAIANAGIGNRVTAVGHAREAVRMEPDNFEYHSLLNQFARGGYAYRQSGMGHGFDMKTVGRTFLQLALAQLLCMFCCRPC